jgi:hypothetical protein
MNKGVQIFAQRPWIFSMIAASAAILAGALVGPLYLVAGHSIGKSLVFGSVFTVLMFAWWMGLLFAYRALFMRRRSQRDGSDN